MKTRSTGRIGRIENAAVPAAGARTVFVWDDGDGSVATKIAARRARGEIAAHDRIVLCCWRKPDAAEQADLSADLPADLSADLSAEAHRAKAEAHRAKAEARTGDQDG